MCVFKNGRSRPTTSLNTKELSERLTIGTAGRFCASQAPQLCLAAARMNLRLAPPPVPACDLTDAPCPHGSSKFVSVFAMSRIRNCGAKNVGNCHLVMYVPVVCMLCALLLMFFLSCFAVLTTRLTDSVDHPSTRNTHLAVATLVITIAGPLRTNTFGCSRISSRRLCAS